MFIKKMIANLKIFIIHPIKLNKMKPLVHKTDQNQAIYQKDRAHTISSLHALKTKQNRLFSEIAYK